MNRFLQFMDKYLLPVMAQVSEQRHLRAVRDGIISTIPLIIVGSFFLIVAFPPVPALAAVIKPYVMKILFPFRLTMGLLGLYASFGIAYSLAKSYKLDALSGGLLGMAAFLLTNLPVNVEGRGWVLAMESLSGHGMFVAIIMSIIAVEILRFTKERNLMIKMPEGVPESVARSFAALIPAAVIISGIALLRFGLEFDIQLFVTALFEPLVIAGNTLPGVIVPILFECALWFTGIHGGSIVGSVARPVWLVLLDQNVAAVAAGQPIPNIAPEPFFQWFVWIGGSGATIGLVLLMLRSKVQYIRSVGKAALLPGICNINEPVIFGLPVMLNPLMFIPFVVGPLVCGVVTWFAMYFDLVARPYVLAPWTLPAPIGAYLATGGDWRAIILVVVNTAITTALFYPFFKAYEKRLLQETEEGRQMPAGGRDKGISG